LFNSALLEKDAMPELPEVETIVQQIRSRYKGQIIKQVEAKPERIFQNISAIDFCNALKGKRMVNVQRFGKFIIWNLESIFPVFHLGMSGIFLEDRNKSRLPQHIHINFLFENNMTLYFQDVRKFGKVYLYFSEPDFDGMGIDPLANSFTFDQFLILLKSTGKNIKSLLMDQQIITGVGNIYANEVLFHAGINPLRRANKISRKPAERLFFALKEILVQAIDRFGTTYSAYQTVDGTTGENQNFLKVYQKEGQECINCLRPIVKITINSRSTFYCRHCQK
jgi:formamidopyrimidine-DNA glycosylase